MSVNPLPLRKNKTIMLSFPEIEKKDDDNTITIHTDEFDLISENLPTFENKPNLDELIEFGKDVNITIDEHINKVKDDLLLLLVMRHIYTNKLEENNELNDLVNDYYDILHVLYEIVNCKNNIL